MKYLPYLLPLLFACRDNKVEDTDTVTDPPAEASTEPSSEASNEPSNEATDDPNDDPTDDPNDNPTDDPTESSDATGATGSEFCGATGTASNTAYSMNYCFSPASLTLNASNSTWSVQGDAQSTFSPE